ncbi:MAG: Rieske (2Fe-2S) protein [Planctomycetota bacterium]
MSTTPPLQAFRFCASGELAPGQVRSARVGGRAVAVLRAADGSLTAFGALCPHQQADLAHGLVVDGGITCADHLWHFELPSGRCTSIEGASLPVYGVREAEGFVVVEVVPR